MNGEGYGTAGRGRVLLALGCLVLGLGWLAVEMGRPAAAPVGGGGGSPAGPWPVVPQSAPVDGRLGVLVGVWRDPAAGLEPMKGVPVAYTREYVRVLRTQIGIGLATFQPGPGGREYVALPLLTCVRLLTADDEAVEVEGVGWHGWVVPATVATGWRAPKPRGACP